MDFSSTRFDCPDLVCRKHQIGTLLNHIWHYFDCVVVDDPIGFWIGTEARSSHQVPNERILSEIALHLHLLEIGASRLMVFRHKPRPAADKWRSQSKAGNPESIASGDLAIIADFEAEAQFWLTEESGERLAYVRHPLCNTSQSWEVPKPIPLDKQTRLLLARAELAQHSAYLADDIAAARHCALPLGLAVPLHERLLADGRPPSVAEVAYKLELPVLKGISAATIVAIREESRNTLLAFATDCALPFKSESEQLRLNAQP